jgi:hypothetical protein
VSKAAAPCASSTSADRGGGLLARRFGLGLVGMNIYMFEQKAAGFSGGRGSPDG